MSPLGLSLRDEPRSATRYCMSFVAKQARSRKTSGERPEGTAPSLVRLGKTGSSSSRSVLREAWAEFLGRVPWHVFATLTYRRPTGAEVLIKNINRWLWLWQLKTAIERGQASLAYDGGHDPFGPPPRDRTSHPRRARGPWPNAYRHGRCYAQWVAGIEPHKSGRLHAHVMIHWSDRLNGLRRTDGWKLWCSSSSAWIRRPYHHCTKQLDQPAGVVQRCR